MPFDSSGTFNRVTPGGWKADAAAGIKIRADRHDSEDDGFAQGLSTCITKDGRTQPTANLPMNGKKLTGVGEPTGPADAATKNYVDTFRSFPTGVVISGADANGKLTFSSPTGVNGLAWTGADLSWLARLGVSGVSYNRLVLNNKADGTGTDVAVVDAVGNGTFNGTVTSSQVFQSSSVIAILAPTGAGTCYMRPNGAGSGVGQMYVNSSGAMNVAGSVTASGGFEGSGFNTIGFNASLGIAGNLRCKAGTSGGYVAQYATFYWNGTNMILYADNTSLGPIGAPSDYRIKKDVADLPSTWDQVKALRPISYTQAEFGPLFAADDIPRWGFIAHELQETLLPSAATGVKDCEDQVQSPNWPSIVAALTKALQEAMARIEALEARA